MKPSLLIEQRKKLKRVKDFPLYDTETQTLVCKIDDMKLKISLNHSDMLSYLKKIKQETVIYISEEWVKLIYT